MCIWTKPVLVKLDIAETLRGVRPLSRRRRWLRDHIAVMKV